MHSWLAFPYAEPPLVSANGALKVLVFRGRRISMAISLILLIFSAFWGAAFAIAFQIFLLDSASNGLPPFVMSIVGFLFTWLSWKWYRFFGSRIEYDETGFARVVGRRRDFTRWMDVSSIDVVGIIGELRLNNSLGDSVMIRKAYIGSLDFITTMRRHVPEAIWASALRFYEPGRVGSGGRPKEWGNPDPFDSVPVSTPEGARARRKSFAIAFLVALLLFSPIIFVIIWMHVR